MLNVNSKGATKEAIKLCVFRSPPCFYCGDEKQVFWTKHTIIWGSRSTQFLRRIFQNWNFLQSWTQILLSALEGRKKAQQEVGIGNGLGDLWNHKSHTTPVIQIFFSFFQNEMLWLQISDWDHTVTWSWVQKNSRWAVGSKSFKKERVLRTLHFSIFDHNHCTSYPVCVVHSTDLIQVGLGSDKEMWHV